MSSRITCASERERILRELGIQQIAIDYRPRYNIAPTQPVVTAALPARAEQELLWDASPCAPDTSEEESLPHASLCDFIEIECSPRIAGSSACGSPATPWPITARACMSAAS